MKKLLFILLPYFCLTALTHGSNKRAFILERTQSELCVGNRATCNIKEAPEISRKYETLKHCIMMECLYCKAKKIKNTKKAIVERKASIDKINREKTNESPAIVQSIHTANKKTNTLEINRYKELYHSTIRECTPTMECPLCLIKNNIPKIYTGYKNKKMSSLKFKDEKELNYTELSEVDEFSPIQKTINLPNGKTPSLQREGSCINLNDINQNDFLSKKLPAPSSSLIFKTDYINRYFGSLFLPLTSCIPVVLGCFCWLFK